jgi:hypothetical protein
MTACPRRDRNSDRRPDHRARLARDGLGLVLRNRPRRNSEEGATGYAATLMADSDDTLSQAPTPAAGAARVLSQGASPPFLFNHCVRTHAWAVEFARLDGVAYDSELLLVGALLHDLGLTERFDGPRCFENQSAAATTAFAIEHGWEALRAERLGEAIRLHMHHGVVAEDSAEGYLLSEATSCDVLGHRLAMLSRHVVDDVLANYPRLSFGVGFLALFEAQAGAKPGCLVDLYLQRGFAEKIRTAPFED